MATESQPDSSFENRLTLAMNPSSAGLVAVSLGTENRAIVSVALDLLEEIYAKLMDKTGIEAKQHVRSLYESHYTKYMAETQAVIDHMEGVTPKDNK
jgi:hypothetical protein